MTMVMKQRVEHGQTVAVITGDEAAIADVQAALDLAMSAIYEADTSLVAIDKRVLSEEFFELRTGLAGGILQKFVDYRVKAAIFGDFSGYASEALQALIRESNRGRDVFFVATEDEAVQRLAVFDDRSQSPS